MLRMPINCSLKTLTTASKRPLTTARRQDMTAMCAYETIGSTLSGRTGSRHRTSWLGESRDEPRIASGPAPPPHLGSSPNRFSDPTGRFAT